MPVSENMIRAQIFVGHTMHEVTVPNGEELEKLFSSLGQSQPFVISTEPDSDGVRMRVFINPASVHSALVKEVQSTGEIIKPPQFQLFRGDSR